MIKLDITIDGQSVDKQVDSLRKAIVNGQKSNLNVRNDVLRYFSDFISTRGPFKDASGSSSFTKPSSAPDMQGSIKDFMNFFKTEFTPSSLTSGAQVYAEVKQRVSSSTRTTITSLRLDTPTRDKFESNFLLTKGLNDNNEMTYYGAQVNTMTSEALKAFISGNQKLENQILTIAREKFQNLVYINYLDKRHDNKPTVKVLKDASNVLRLDSINSPYLLIEARRTQNKNKTDVGIQLQIKLSPAGDKKVSQAGVDVTKAFHASLGKNVASRFIKYAATRYGSRGSSSDFPAFIESVITLANEFADGSHTPIDYETSTKSIKRGKITSTITLPVPKSTNSQRFISSVQWTALTRARLGDTMRKSGKAMPADFTERSGRFRGSVEVFVNYRAKVLRYTYDPLYEHNIAYGYDPDEQVARALREVAQQAFVQQFNIIKA